MPDSDGAALLRAILDNPADNTVRLVYADWLDESGTDAARAEFVRVQVELARLPKLESEYPLCTACGGDGLATGPPESRPCRKCDSTGKRDHKQYKHTRRLLGRERELLAYHGRSWARVVCPNCKGTGVCDGGYVGHFACPHCSPMAASEQEAGEPGTGDAMQRDGAQYEFRRGSVERVTVPALAWVCEFVPPKWDNPPEWRVTPWALAIARTHPVTEFGIGDREPWLQQDDYVWWGWINGERENEVPQELVRLMIEAGARHAHGSVAVYFKTREAALLALAQVAGRLVRRAAGYAN